MRKESMEECFWRQVEKAEGGHLRWTGKVGPNGTPYMRWGPRTLAGAGGQAEYSGRKVAFRIRYNREPKGYVKAGCTASWCCLPNHMTDRVTRERNRQAFNGVFGSTDLPEADSTEHDWTGPSGVHGADVDAERRRQVHRDHAGSHVRQHLDGLSLALEAAERITGDQDDERLQLARAHLTQALKYTTLWHLDIPVDHDVPWAATADKLLRGGDDDDHPAQADPSTAKAKG